MAGDLPRDLQRELDGVVAAHAALGRVLDGLTDEQARSASLLPDWSVGHVLTHLARNADGMTAMLRAAARDEVAAQYPGGAEQRAADIDAGADRPADELVDDVIDSAAAFERAASSLDPRQWATGQGISFNATIPIADVVFRRRREVLVHTSDLGLATGDVWAAWPADFVRAELDRMTMLWRSRRPMGLVELPGRHWR